MTEEIIKFLGGSAILIGIVAWLVRSLIRHLLSKDVETFKARIASESAAELEKLTHELRFVAVEHEKRTQLLEEKRAQTIEDLYSRLVDFLAAAESFASVVEYGNSPSKEDKAQVLGEKASDFWVFFLRKRIYFTEELCQKVDQLFQEVHGSASHFRVWLARAESSDRAARKMYDAWDEAWDVMKDKVPPLKAAVESEFRTLLGVTPLGSVDARTCKLA